MRNETPFSKNAVMYREKEREMYAFNKERQSHSPSPTIHLISSPADTRPTIFQMSAKPSAKLHAC